jgi:hypothetical protein
MEALDARRFLRFLERTRRAPSLARRLSYMSSKAPPARMLFFGGERSNIEKTN